MIEGRSREGLVLRTQETAAVMLLLVTPQSVDQSYATVLHGYRSLGTR